MPWYDVYDNVEVQLVTRKQAAAVSGTVTAVLIFCIVCIAVGLEGHAPLSAGIGTAVAACAVLAWWLVEHTSRLRRIVWCVKLSKSEVVGYDYARRRRSVAWRDVERIDIGDDGLTIAGPNSASLQIPHLFTEYPQVSHRIVSRADRLGIPIFLNGTPWQQIDVYELFPFLSEDASSSTRGSAAL